ncbi:MAG TPA: YdiU family protein [Spirochaetes bacterium]|nr:YdiU family protein [Spirochaetota bacterium]
MEIEYMTFDNTYHKLPDRFYKEVTAERFSKPELLAFNENLSDDLGLNLGSQSDIELANFFSGQTLLKGSHPIALPYAGHQFGHFVPQLGDGRAMLLGEIVNPDSKRFDIQLKGSGQTFFSRNGDGKSAIGPVIREYILSEAMYHLGVPTTRALAAVATGDLVYREETVPGAVFTRIASSHIRIGTFQYFAAKDDLDGLKTLLDYSIQRHYPESGTNPAISFLQKVIQAQVSLVSNWMSLGFIHGVMNTDNMSISGETIDYGPCAFMDQFNAHQVYSFIDRDGRYSYMNQGPILQWNLSRLADCLIPLVHSDKKKAIEMLNSELATISDLFRNEWIERMKRKLGLVSGQAHENDEKLITSWLDYLEKEELDFTLSFRKLEDLLVDNDNLSDSFFKQTTEFDTFKTAWTNRLKDQDLELAIVKEKMNGVNPIYIPRNHQVERAIQQAIVGDLSVFNEMNQVLKNPYVYQPNLDFYRVTPLPEEEVTTTFCGT